MRSTSLRLLLTIASLAAVVGWALLRIVDALVGRYLPVSTSAVVAVWLLTLALFFWTLYVRPRLSGKPGVVRLDSLVATRTAALAMAASRTGAAFCGLYLGISVGFLEELAVPAGQRGAVVSGLAALGGAVLCAISVWLERICRVDDDADGDSLAVPDPPEE